MNQATMPNTQPLPAASLPQATVSHGNAGHTKRERLARARALVIAQFGAGVLVRSAIATAASSRS